MTSTATPFGQLPILEIGDRTIAQSIAIARFLAKKFSLYGEDDLQQASADMVVDYVSEFNDSTINYLFYF